MELTPRQESVLRALVRAYVGEAAPVGSASLAQTLPEKISSASIRATMGELAELGLLEKTHSSSGRVPTETGLRVFVDQLLAPRAVGAWERRLIEHELGEAARDVSLQVASELLAARTHQLGFALLPRLDRVALRYASLVRLSSERVLVVLVSRSGIAYQRVLRDRDSGDQARLEQLAGELNRRIAGHTLSELHALLEHEIQTLRDRASQLAMRSLLAAVDALESEARAAGADVLLASPALLLDQPEFHDPERMRELLALLETHKALLAFLDRVIDAPGVAVTFGGEADVPELRDCAAVTAPIGAGAPARVGVLGPSRMDYTRVVPLVGLLSRVVTEKLDS